MSKIFYDHLIILEEVNIHIDNLASSKEEKEELWNLIDELIHSRIFGVILDHLPREHHEEFIDKLHRAPHDERHLMWLNEKVQRNIEDVIREEAKLLEQEILKEIKKTDPKF